MTNGSTTGGGDRGGTGRSENGVVELPGSTVMLTSAPQPSATSSTPGPSSRQSKAMLAGPPKIHSAGPRPDVFLTLRPERERARVMLFTANVCFALGVSLAVVMLLLTSYKSDFVGKYLLLNLTAQVVCMSLVVMGLVCHLNLLRFTYMRWHCPGCDKTLHDHAEWFCSYCDHHNRGSSFLHRCSNNGCRASPLSYQCEHCGVLSFFTAERNGRHPARLNKPKAPPTKSAEETRIERAQVIEAKEHTLRELQLELQLAHLKAKLEPPKVEVVSPRQARINWLAERMEEAREKCKTIQQTVTIERELKADIDKSNSEDELKARMKEAVGIHFEETRRKMGVPDVRV
jgi:hypothetical protein